ncbi:MAG: benzoate-CoA ligase family protein [Planctomycetes bacterium]|nr:benzoate-CoA ligase family protein [Planctomycetota bacterium]
MFQIPDAFNMATYFLDDRLREGTGEKIAIRHRDRDLTYLDVVRESNRVGNVLRDLGAGIEDRVYICLPDIPEFAPVFFGVLKIGAVVTMGNPRLPADDYEYYLNYTRAKVAVIHESVADVFLSVRPKAKYLKNLLVVGRPSAGLPHYDSLVPEAGEHLELAETSKDDVACWLFSGGTTGRSKGVVHFHHDFPYNTEHYAKQIVQYTGEDVTLSVPRLYFGYATGTNLMFPFAVGATTALFDEAPTPETIFEKIREFRPTVLTNVPTTIGKMVNHPEAAAQDLSSLRVCLSAGEYLPPELYQRWKGLFKAEILNGIGSAEMFHIYISNRLGDVKPGSLGKLVPGYEAKIVDTEGKECKPGEAGRLHVKGDSAGLCYFLAHEKSKETFAGDWCFTSDLFRVDEEGYYWYEGRVDDLLKVGGIFVSPIEVENCLLQHSAVLEAAVVGYTDEQGLTKPKAYVVPRPGRTPGASLAEDVQNYVKERLAAYKYPRKIEFVDSLPKTDRGKIDRKKLKT